MSHSMSGLNWANDNTLLFDDIRVELCVPPELYERQSQPGHFILGKSKFMIDEMMEVIGQTQVRNIVDIGVYKGGSVVLFNELFRPSHLLAIDFNPNTPSPLIDYVGSNRRSEHITIAPGVNQADKIRLMQLKNMVFGDDKIDLVVDDASHFFFETRESFRVLFPQLRPGGIYIIEDWGWAHWQGENWQRDQGGDYFRNKPPLTNLLIELMLVAATSPNIVRKITLNGTVAYIERGDQELEEDFEISAHYQNRGRKVPLIDISYPGQNGGIRTPQIQNPYRWG